MELNEQTRLFCGTLKAGYKYVLAVNPSPTQRNWSADMYISETRGGEIVDSFCRPFVDRMKATGVHGAMKTIARRRLKK